MKSRHLRLDVRRTVVARMKRWISPPEPTDERLEALISVGRHSYPRRPRVLHWDYSTRLQIGAFCSLAETLFVLGGNHRTDWVTTFPVRARLELPGAGEDGH